MGLRNYETPPTLRLSLLWAALMGLYIYNDYFSMYLPGTIDDMVNGVMGPLGPATPMIMIAVSLLLAVPALMIFLSATLPARLNQVLNVVFGSFYTVIQVLTFFGSAPFYKIVVVMEIIVTLLIFWTAIRWPKADS